MNNANIPHTRLMNQHIARGELTSPGEVVHWFGAIQAQDYLGSLWAIGLRMQTATEQVIEQAIIDKQFIRTWPMRGTLHFVSPQDIRWMLKLMASRIMKGSAGRHKQLELTEEVFMKCRKIVIHTLQGNKHITRQDLYKRLEESGIYVATTPIGSRGLHILGHLAMEGLICFGPRAGKQQTFVLLDEWVPPVKHLTAEESLAEITIRYFNSHGPATLQDFVWWTGLTVTDAKKGIELVKTKLQQETIEGQTYWFGNIATVQAKKTNPKTAYLLPAFDEYTVSYKNRNHVLDPQFARKVNNGGGLLNPIIVIDGLVVGTWKRTFKKNTVIVTPSLFKQLSKQELAAIEATAAQYSKFLSMSLLFTSL